MSVIKKIIFTVFCGIVMFSCAGETKIEKKPEAAPVKKEAPAPVKEPVTQAERAEIKSDITHFVEKRNEIIRNTNNEVYKKRLAEKDREFAIGNKRFDTAEEDEKKITLADKAINMYYNEWQQCLTDRYRKHFSKPEVLERISKSARLQQEVLKGKTLKSLEDFFVNVVCWTRKNAHVDEIEFIGGDKNRVKVLTKDNKDMVRLYDVVHEKDGWKIDITDDIANGLLDY